MEQPGATALPKRGLFYRWLKRRRHDLNRFAARFSKIPNDPVLDPAQFDWIAQIEPHWQDIRAEALRIYRHVDAIPPLREISPDHRRIAPDDSWRSFFLIGYGNEAAENTRRAPITTTLVKQIPGLNSAFFSILAPGAHIVRHRGVSKSIFTAHLGLAVPKQRELCRMKVEDQIIYWREGQWTVFDDTYEHEVWNESEQPRIILLCQIARPLRWPGNWLAALFMAYLKRSAFVTEAKQELALWEDAYASAERAERVDA